MQEILARVATFPGIETIDPNQINFSEPTDPWAGKQIFERESPTRRGKTYPPLILCMKTGFT